MTIIKKQQNFILSISSTDYSPTWKACGEKCHLKHKNSLMITGKYYYSCGKFILNFIINYF